MPLYTYKVKNEAGKIFAGEINIGSQSELTDLLIEKGYMPVEIKEKNVFNDITQISIFKKRVKTKDLAVFCRQFAIVLEAGVPIATAMDVLREQTQNSTLKECLNDVYENIQKGTSLSISMKQHSNVFPEMLINMVEAGEVSGQLDSVFLRMADHFEKEFKLNQKIKSAMTYPVIVCVVALGIIVLLMTFVLPNFTNVLKGMKLDLPLYTRILMGISKFLQSFWWLNLLLLIGIVYGIRTYAKSYNGKKFFGTLAISLPVLKGVTKNIITARFTRMLGTLVSSGVLLIQAMEVVQKVLGNAVVAEMLDSVIEEVKKGRGLTQPLSSLKYFPPMVISMVRIGEESGELDFALSKSADFYDQELETSMQQLTSLIEPLIIIVLAVVVGGIILGVLAPMFSIYQNLST